MNGKIQGIIVGGVVVVCLAGVMVFLQHSSNSTDTDESSTTSSSTSSKDEDESVVILSKTVDEIKSVYVNNTYGEYTLEKPASGKSIWTIDKLTTVNQNTSLEDSMRTNIGEMEAYKLVEKNASDMSKYGLDKPVAYFTVTYDDDSEATLEIGTNAPNEKYSYVRIKGEDTVYMILGTKLSYFTDPVTAYVTTALIATPSDDDYPDYGIETITRKDWDYEVTFEQDPYDIEPLSGQVMTSPIFSYLNVTQSSTVTHGLWGLSASSCEVIEPTDEDFKKYGLDDPTCTVSLKGDGYDYFLKVGNPIYFTDESSNETDEILSYYCYLTGVSGADCIFVISADSLPWTSFEPSGIISSLMTTNYLVDLDKITIDYEGKQTVYDITSNGSSDESTTDSGDTVTVTGVTLDGEETDTSNFQSMFQYIIGCPTTEIYFTEPEEAEPYLTITQTRNDGDTDVMEFYKDTSRRAIVKLNGKTSFRIQTSWVDTLVANMDRVKNGEEVETTY